MKKFLSLLAVIFLGLQVQAATISTAIFSSKVTTGAVSVSVKDIATGKTVYKYNDDRPMPPASTLKLLTFSAAQEKLGKDYQFKTAIYKYSSL